MTRWGYTTVAAATTWVLAIRVAFSMEPGSSAQLAPSTVGAVSSLVVLIGLIGLAATTHGVRRGLTIAAAACVLPVVAWSIIAVVLVWGQVYRGWGWPQ